MQRPSSHSKSQETRTSHAQKGSASAPLPALLNRPENMAKKKEKCIDIDRNIDEANLILSKHTALGYLAFLTADGEIQKDAKAQFAAVRENYHLSHPVGLVLTYATLCKYYPDAPAAKVLQLWKQAVQDWQALGDTTRKLQHSHEYKELERLYGRDSKTFDKEKNRKCLIESYIQREEKVRLLARQTGKQPVLQNLGAFRASAFADIEFEDAATNDILLTTMFLANPSGEDLVKREQFQKEKSVKFMDVPAKEKQRLLMRDEPDATDIYLAQLEAGHVKKGRNGDKNPREDRDPKKALAQTGGMLIARTMQQAAKNIAKGIVA
jgi:hypothetical protein